jgi:hypothetical protein
MAKKSSRRSLKGLDEFSLNAFELADEIGGPVTQCVAYKTVKGGKGKMIHRCATFMPSNKAGIVGEATKWVDWSADNRSKLKKPYKYYYKGNYIVNESLRKLYKSKRSKSKSKSK